MREKEREREVMMMSVLSTFVDPIPLRKNGGIIDDRIWNKQYITDERKDDKEYSKSVISQKTYDFLRD